MRLFHIVVPALVLVLACGPDKRGGGNGDGSCTGVCTGLGYEACNADGTLAPPVPCDDGQVCDATAGCVACPPDQMYCGGDSDGDVYQCNSDGTGGTLVMACPADETCSNGACKTPCEAADDNPSNLGCEFWAVDLDNEGTTTFGVSSDAAAQQFSVVAANDNDFDVTVTVLKNTARVGEPVAEMAILQKTVPAHVAQRLDLPQREVDGTMQQNGTYMPNTGSGTFVSPHAYHVVASAPVVVYQFNPIVQQYSNDASTLVPKQALGFDYIVVGYDTANPCGITQLSIPSIPDHAAITVVAEQDDTHVTVTTTHPIMASGGDSGFAIAETAKGGTLTFTTGRYTVVNLESLQVEGSAGDCIAAANAGQTGDFTGTTVHADKPIAVFTAHERGIGFGGATNIVYPPDWDDMNDDICCTDHLEEQLFPETAFGREFAYARSPIRSTDTSWTEPDIIRIVAATDGTVVTTNLPPPNDSIALNKNQQKTFGATTGFAASSNYPIEIASYLVSQTFVKSHPIGDPSQLLIPAAEQFRKQYPFYVPDTFQSNYVVAAKPMGTNVTLDGAPLTTSTSGCTAGDIGMVAGTMYDQITCLVSSGNHEIISDAPFGFSVYGYYNVGSYAFVGGSDIKIINPIGKTTRSMRAP